MTEAEELELLSLERERAMGGEQQAPSPSFAQTMKIMPQMVPVALRETGKFMANQLPALGSVAGGLAGGTAGTVFGMGLGGAPGAMGGAALGGAAGEAGRQLLGRAMGESTPDTSMQAASRIGQQGALGAAGEGIGGLIGKGLGAAYRGLPKVGQMISGTPARNISKAQLRGFTETYFPKAARGVSRETAGANKGIIENQILKQYFNPSEISKMKLNKTGYANKVVEDSLTAMIQKKKFSPARAIQTVKSVDAVYRDTPIGSKVAPELAGLRRYADAFLAKAHPEYKAAKRVSESTILKSQLSKPFRVNKSRPDEFSGFTGAIMPAVGAGIMGTGGSVLPAVGAALSASPLAFGGAASIMGSIKRTIPALVRKTLGRTGAQASIRSAVEALRSRPEEE